MQYSLSKAIAIATAIVLLGFTQPKTTNYYWFKYVSGTGQFIYDRYGSSPSVLCLGFKYPCAKGYVLQPQSDENGQYIYPGTQPDCEFRQGIL